MKSRKVKSAARSKAYMKKLKSTIPLNDEDNGYDVDKDQESSDNDSSDHEDEGSVEEEVLPITDDESELSDEEDDNNEEEISDDDDDLPDLNNWGKKKSTYFSSDFVDQDRGKTYREEDQKLADEVAEAADLQQQTLLDLGLDKCFEVVPDFAMKKLGKDTSELENDDALSKFEVQQLMSDQRKCPEISEFIKTFKEKFAEYNEKLAPILNILDELKVDDKKFSLYVKTRYQILSHYLANISCYLLMKTIDSVPENHPIYERLEEYKKLIDQMNSQKNYLKAIDDILEKLKQGQKVYFSSKDLPDIVSNNLKRKEEIEANSSRKKKKISRDFESDGESKISPVLLDKNLIGNDSDADLEDMNHGMELDSQIDENTGEKRTITYQIAKNKGLVPRRKKEYRNPRVHNRMKYRKAKIRRKGQVRNVVKEMKRYAGEPTGIAAHVVRSVKLK